MRDALAKLDPVMAKLIERVGPIDIRPRRQTPFQSLAQAIIHQQLSGKAAATIQNRFIALYPGKDFPGPEDVMTTSSEALRAVGLSRPKLSYMKDLAERAAVGGIPTLEQCDLMSDADLIENLTEIRGIGAWTVEMMLIFNLGRTDVLPIHDLGVQKGYQKSYRKRRSTSPEALAKAGKKWAPYRTFAALYLWRSLDTEVG